MSSDEVIKMLVSVQDELARAVLQVNVVQRRDDETIAHLQSELLKAEQRAEKQELRADTLQGLLVNSRLACAKAKDDRDGAEMILSFCRDELSRTRAELASVMAHLPAVKQEQAPRPPAKRKLFGDGDHDVVIHLYDLETPKKK